MPVCWLRVRGDENNHLDSLIPGGELFFDRIHHKYLDRYIGIKGFGFGTNDIVWEYSVSTYAGLL